MFEMPSMSGLMAGILFSLVGLVGWKMGRQKGNAAMMLIGASLMIYTFVVPDGILVWAVGLGLCAGLYYTRDWES
jgi:hypothetical protein